MSSTVEEEMDLPSPQPSPMPEEDLNDHDQGNYDNDNHGNSKDEEALSDNNDVLRKSSNDGEGDDAGDGEGDEEQRRGAASPARSSSSSVTRDTDGDGGDDAEQETRKRLREVENDDQQKRQQSKRTGDGDEKDDESIGFMSDEEEDQGNQDKGDSDKEDSDEEDEDVDKYQKEVKSKKKQQQKEGQSALPLSLLTPRRRTNEAPLDPIMLKAAELYLENHPNMSYFQALEGSGFMFDKEVTETEVDEDGNANDGINDADWLVFDTEHVTLAKRKQQLRKTIDILRASQEQGTSPKYTTNDVNEDSDAKSDSKKSGKVKKPRKRGPRSHGDNRDYGVEFLFVTQAELLPSSDTSTERAFPRPDLFPAPSNCNVSIRLIKALQNPFLASRTIDSLVKWKFYSADYALATAFMEKGGCRHLVTAMDKCLDIGTVKLKNIIHSSMTNNEQEDSLDKADEGGAFFLAQCLTLMTDILEASYHANSVAKALTHFQNAGACAAVCRALLYHIKFVTRKNKLFENERVKASDEFVVNEKLLYRACCAIGHFAYPKLFERHIVDECHGVVALLAALEACPKRLKIQGAVCLALYNLSNQSAPDSTTRAALMHHLQRGAVLKTVKKRVTELIENVKFKKMYASPSDKYIKEQILKAGPVVLTFVDKVRECLFQKQDDTSGGKKDQKNLWLFVKRGENDEEDFY